MAKDKTVILQKAQNPCGFWYFLGMIGSAVFFIQQVQGFWPVVLSLLEALVWPAFLIYDLFKFLVR